MGDQMVGLDFVDDVTNFFAFPPDYEYKVLKCKSKQCEQNQFGIKTKFVKAHMWAFTLSMDLRTKQIKILREGHKRGFSLTKGGGDMATDVVKIFKSNKY